jgi:hypothetical protein
MMEALQGKAHTEKTPSCLWIHFHLKEGKLNSAVIIFILSS